jgi:hypothetical protein
MRWRFALLAANALADRLMRIAMGAPNGLTAPRSHLKALALYKMHHPVNNVERLMPTSVGKGS